MEQAQNTAVSSQAMALLPLMKVSLLPSRMLQTEPTLRQVLLLIFSSGLLILPPPCSRLSMAEVAVHPRLQTMRRNAKRRTTTRAVVSIDNQNSEIMGKHSKFKKKVKIAERRIMTKAESAEMQIGSATESAEEESAKVQTDSTDVGHT